jgi:hypothetical protein
MNITTQILGWFLPILVLFAFALIAGTILWILWPLVVPTVFPKIVEDGYITGEISWITSVLFWWFARMLATVLTKTKISA